MTNFGRAQCAHHTYSICVSIGSSQLVPSFALFLRRTEISRRHHQQKAIQPPANMKSQRRRTKRIGSNSFVGDTLSTRALKGFQKLTGKRREENFL
jgi:hypothetical protein